MKRKPKTKPLRRTPERFIEKIQNLEKSSFENNYGTNHHKCQQFSDEFLEIIANTMSATDLDQ